MTHTIELPVWLFAIILVFAIVTFASHFLFPSVRWYFRRRLQRAVDRLNRNLAVPIEPFRLARRTDMIQRLIYDPEVTQAIVVHAKTEGVREDVAFETARRYAREIVPRFSAFAYFGFGTRAARAVGTALYDVQTGPQNDAVLAQIPPEATAVFIMNHRSNMDYVLVTFLAARASALSYAVGEWARVWPLSALIRSMGAYFIRRRARGALYRRVLARYVQKATEGGVTQAMFPEGGLSLDGRIAPPKYGLMAYVCAAYHSAGRDVAFVPVAINYDRVLEDRVLVAAGQNRARGGDRRFDASVPAMFRFVTRHLWRRVTGRYQKFGTASVVFGPPLILSTFAQNTKPEAVARVVMQRIADQMPVLDVPLAAYALTATRAIHPVSFDELLSAAPAVSGAREKLERGLTHLAHRQIIRETENRWQICEAEQALVAYYAQSLPEIGSDS